VLSARALKKVIFKTYQKTNLYQFLLRNRLPLAVNFLKFQLCIVVDQSSNFRKKRIAGMFQHYYPEGGWGFLVLGRDSKIIHFKENFILLHDN
jgi:hypothetical protein